MRKVQNEQEETANNSAKHKISPSLKTKKSLKICDLMKKKGNLL